MGQINWFKTQKNIVLIICCFFYLFKLRTDAFPYSEAVKVWIEQMLQKNPDRRPNIFQVDDTLNSLLHKPIAEEQDIDSEVKLGVS